ncbi:MAG: transposase family protein [Candidatus Competibacteraceae bacterium]|nr:transposase family protein [Candidatus Competibacteraceae bacterium]
MLFYLKTYPLQEVLAHLFGMSQGQAHFLIYQLSRIFARNAEANGSSSSANF